MSFLSVGAAMQRSPSEMFNHLLELNERQERELEIEAGTIQLLPFAEAIFDFLDEDGDGFLTVGELVHSLHISRSEAAALVEEAEQAVHGHIQDRQLTVEEFTKLLAQLDEPHTVITPALLTRYQASFKRCDKDGDGLIKLDELVEDLGVTKAEAMEMFALAGVEVGDDLGFETFAAILALTERTSARTLRLLLLENNDLKKIIVESKREATQEELALANQRLALEELQAESRTPQRQLRIDYGSTNHLLNHAVSTLQLLGDEDFDDLLDEDEGDRNSAANDEIRRVHREAEAAAQEGEGEGEGEREGSKPKKQKSRQVLISPQITIKRPTVEEDQEVEMVAPSAGSRLPDQAPKDRSHSLRLSLQSVKPLASFTAKQARLELADTVSETERDMGRVRKLLGRGKKKRSVFSLRRHKKRREPETRVTLYTQYALTDKSLRGVKVALYVKQGENGAFVKVSESESAEFAIFRFTTPASLNSYFRLLYSALGDDNKHHVLGYVTDHLSVVLDLSEQDASVEKNIRSAHAAEYIGTAVVTCEEMRKAPFNAVMALGLAHHKPVPGRSLFLKVERLVRGLGMTLVYSSTLPLAHGAWDRFKVPLRKLCNGDVDLKLLVAVEEVSKDAAHGVRLGYCETSVAQLQRNEGQTLPLELNGKRLEMALDVKQFFLQRFQSADVSAPANTGQVVRLRTGTKLHLKTLHKESAARGSVPALRPHAKQRDQSFRRAQAVRHQGYARLLAHDLRLWLQTDPLNRFLNRMPLRSTVVAVSLKFGSGVAAFFAVYNWLIFLNFLLAVIWMAMVVVPRASDQQSASSFVDTLAGAFAARTSTSRTSALWSWYGDYTKQQDGTPDFYSVYGLRDCCSQEFPDAYFKGDFDPSVPYAWAVVVTILASFWLIVMEARKTYNDLDSVVATDSVATGSEFSSALFGRWDHNSGSVACIHAQAIGIFQELRALLEAKKLESLREHQQRRLSFHERSCLLLRRTVFIGTSLLLAIGAIVVIYFVTTNQDTLSEKFSFLPALILAVVNAVVPMATRFCVKHEQWHNPGFESRNIIGREFVIKVANVLTLYYRLRLRTTQASLDKLGFQCVQDLIGDTFLRLYLVESAADLAHAVFWPLFTVHVKGKPHHFDVPGNVLNLIYRELIVWTGTPFCPVLPLMSFVSCTLAFTWRSLSCTHLSVPSSRPWPAARARLFFMQTILLTSFFGAIPEIHFLYSDFNASSDDDDGAKFQCGPHIDWQASHPHRGSVFSYLLNWEHVPEGFQNVIVIAFHPVLLVLCLLVSNLVSTWLQKVLSKTTEELRQLQADLEDERYDKMVLLREAGIEV